MYDLEQTLIADAWNDLLERLHDAVSQLPRARRFSVLQKLYEKWVTSVGVTLPLFRNITAAEAADRIQKSIQQELQWRRHVPAYRGAYLDARRDAILLGRLKAQGGL